MKRRHQGVLFRCHVKESTTAEYDAWVERLRTLEIKIVYPGHGKPFQRGQFIENDQ